MPSFWLSSALPKIQTDLKNLGQSRHAHRPQKDLNEGTSSSSGSRNSSFLVTPSSSRPSHLRLSPRHDDELYSVSDEATHPRASSALTLKPLKVAYNPPDHPDHGFIRHSDRSTPFPKPDQCITGRRGHASTRTKREQPMPHTHNPYHVKDDVRHTQPREDPPNQTTQALHPQSPGRNRGLRRLSFPKRAIRDVCDSNDAASSCSHATSRAGSPMVALSRSNSQKGKYKLGPHRFLVSQKVGEGGFGRVYKAIEIHSGQTIAVKTVSRKGLSRPRVDATLKEQKVAQRISRNQGSTGGNGGDFVVRMLASFLTPNHFVFVLDYHGAGDLRDVDFPLKTEHARFYVGEMALGLRFIHSLDIVMRDLKPANVLLDFNGHIKLADFGLSAMADQVTEPGSRSAEPERPASRLSIVRTRTISLGSSSINIPTLDLGNRKRSKTTAQAPKLFNRRGSRTKIDRQRCPIVFCGTPGYISPEGYKGRYGPENDVWALGISLYEFITGENPFDMWGVPTVEIQKKVEDADIFYPDGMPDVTKDIISQLLRRKWQKRMTIEEMMEHPFFHIDGFSWEKLAKKEVTPPPLPDIARKRLRQSLETSQQPQVPLILHLEAESMRNKDGFVEELGAQEMVDFEMDGLDIISTLKEEQRGLGDIW